MSHHFDTSTAREDPRINLCDFYLFSGGPAFGKMRLTVRDARFNRRLRRKTPGSRSPGRSFLHAEVPADRPVKLPRYAELSGAAAPRAGILQAPSFDTAPRNLAS
jgi:hypothetical protein